MNQESISERFERYISNHAHYKKLWRTLKLPDLVIITSFIENNSHLEKDSFEYKLNRLFLDKIEKPKKWSLIMEFLSTFNNWRTWENEK